MSATAGASPGASRLNRVLTLWPLILYGLGVIVGAGIYVALGAVMRRAGEAAPLSFLLAGVTAALTGLCYAELAGRFPEASGGVAYVRHGFGSERLAQATGVATMLVVAVSAASIASGTTQYLIVLMKWPVPLLMTLMIGAFTAIAIAGVGASVGLAGAIGALEIGGLIVAIAAGFWAAPDFDMRGMIPSTALGWGGMAAGAFIAFFAFIGFETLANMGEEVVDAQRTLPRGILGAVGISIVLYVLVVTAVVLSDRAGANPLVALFGGKTAAGFAIVGALAVGNGVLVQIVMLSRLLYGMANRRELPRVLAWVHPRLRTPVPATLLAGGAILAVTVLVPFEHLLALSNAITLTLFALVDLALWRLRRMEPPPARGASAQGRPTQGRPTQGTLAHGTPAQGTPALGFRAPGWVPPLAAASCLVLLACEVLF